MAEMLLSLGATLLGGGAAAAGSAGAAGATMLASGSAAGAGAVGSGLSLATIMQGGATVLGIVSSIGAGNAAAAEAEMAAQDAETEQALETLQGINRRNETRKALISALGAQDTAYAASGVDLSVGTAAQARQEALREGDSALETGNNTELTRVSRLAERASRYRAQGKQKKLMGYLDGAIGGAKGIASIAGRY